MATMTSLPDELILRIAARLIPLGTSPLQRDMRPFCRFMAVNKQIYDCITHWRGFWQCALEEKWIFSNAGLRGRTADLYECTPPHVSPGIDMPTKVTYAHAVFVQRLEIDRDVEGQIQALLAATTGQEARALEISRYGTDAADKLFQLLDEAADDDEGDEEEESETLVWYRTVLRHIGEKLCDRLLMQVQARPKHPIWGETSDASECLDMLFVVTTIILELDSEWDVEKARKRVVAYVRHQWMHTPSCSIEYDRKLGKASCVCDATHAWNTVAQAVFREEEDDMFDAANDTCADLVHYAAEAGNMGYQILMSTLLTDLGHPAWLVSLPPGTRNPDGTDCTEAVAIGDPGVEASAVLYFWDLRRYTTNAAVTLTEMTADLKLKEEDLLRHPSPLEGPEIAARLAEMVLRDVAEDSSDGYSDEEDDVHILAAKKIIDRTGPSSLSMAKST